MHGTRSFAANCTTGGSFKTVKGIKESRFYFRPRKNIINVAHCRHEIIIARTYPTQVNCYVQGFFLYNDNDNFYS